MKLSLLFIKIIRFNLLLFFILIILSNVKFVNNGNVLIVYVIDGNSRIISKIETKNIKKTFRFNYKFNLMENSSIYLDKNRDIFLEKGAIVFSKNRYDEINYKLFFNNNLGETQFLRIESSSYITDLSSDIEIKYYYKDENFVIKPKLHYLFSNNKRYYYGFFIPYSIFYPIYKVAINVIILSANKKYAEIKFENEVKTKEWEKQIIKFNPKKSKALRQTDKKKFEIQRKKRWKIWGEVSLLSYFKDGYNYPIEDTSYLTSNFGFIREWRLGNNKLYSKDIHSGIDYANIKGTPVYACSSGIVKYAENGEYVGNMVIIDHGLGLASGYMHLDTISVKENQFVKKGDEIGKMGATGAATAPHIHWEIRIYGIPIDPLTLFNIEQIFN